jgi:hypothetical protein
MFARGFGGSSDNQRQTRCAGQQRRSAEVSQHLGSLLPARATENRQRESLFRPDGSTRRQIRITLNLFVRPLDGLHHLQSPESICGDAIALPTTEQ